MLATPGRCPGTRPPGGGLLARRLPRTREERWNRPVRQGCPRRRLRRRRRWLRLRLPPPRRQPGRGRAALSTPRASPARVSTITCRRRSWARRDGYADVPSRIFAYIIDAIIMASRSRSCIDLRGPLPGLGPGRLRVHVLRLVRGAGAHLRGRQRDLLHLHLDEDARLARPACARPGDPQRRRWSRPHAAPGDPALALPVRPVRPAQVASFMLGGRVAGHTRSATPYLSLAATAPAARASTTSRRARWSSRSRSRRPPAASGAPASRRQDAPTLRPGRRHDRPSGVRARQHREAGHPRRSPRRSPLMSAYRSACSV
jgi:hypothetical protein